MVKVGIIGCGKIAQRRHVPEYASNIHAKIIGYFDARKEAAEALAAQYGGKVYDSIDDMLSDPEVEAVSVCTSNNTHAEVSIQAMRAGKHVLCEKPMARTVEECEEMLRVAKEMNCFLMIGQNQRFNTGHVRAKELIEQGIIGRPLSFKTSFCHGGPERWLAGPDSDDMPKDIWFFDKKIAGLGVMADLGIHKIDLMQYLLGQKIKEVTAKVLTLDKKDSSGNLIELEDNAICIFKMENGVIGTMNASWTDYGEEDNSTVIFGTKGLMRIYDNNEHTIQISTDRGDKIYYDLDRMMTNMDQRESGVIREFVRELEKNDWSNAADEFSVNAIRVVQASFQSSIEDRTIKL